jgi:hypothetical protein
MAVFDSGELRSGNIFRLRSRVVATIASGLTGTLQTLTAPTGQVARLTYLYAASANQQPGISVIADGNTVLSGILGENDSSPTGDFVVAEKLPISTSAPLSDALRTVNQVVGNVIVISKNAGNTTQPITYCVEYGVIQ